MTVNGKKMYNHWHSPIKGGYKLETGFLGKDLGDICYWVEAIELGFP